MSEAAELSVVLDDLIRALSHIGIPYFVTGSIASSVHAEFRATNDVDIVADLTADHARRLVAQLSDDFVADADAAADAVSARSSFNLIHRATLLKVDVFPKSTTFDAEAMRRAEAIALPNTKSTLRVATVEDILLAKLNWYKLGGEESEVQRRDIRSLIAMNREGLDQAHLDKWAKVLGISDLLGRFLGDEVQ